MATIKELNEQLLKGKLPPELNFTITEKESNIDWDKVRYQAFYKTYEFHAQKFPQGLQNLTGIDKVIQKMADCALTPLEEINNRAQAKSEVILSDEYEL